MRGRGRYVEEHIHHYDLSFLILSQIVPSFSYSFFFFLFVPFFFGFLVWPPSYTTTTPPAPRSNPKIDLRRILQPRATCFLRRSRGPRCDFFFFGRGGGEERRRRGENRGTRLNWANVAVDSDLFFSLVQDVLFGFTRLFG